MINIAVCDDDVQFAAALEEKILDYGNISQPEMADILGISYSYYNNIEKGNRSCPIEVLIEICREFGISSDRILRDFVPVDTGGFCLK